jgi:hypothetical protein
MILIFPHSICLGNPNLGNFQESISRNCASLLIRRRLGVEMGAGRWWRIEMADRGGEIGDGKLIDIPNTRGVVIFCLCCAIMNYNQWFKLCHALTPSRCSNLLSMLCYHALTPSCVSPSRGSYHFLRHSVDPYLLSFVYIAVTPSRHTQQRVSMTNLSSPSARSQCNKYRDLIPNYSVYEWWSGARTSW